MAAERIFRIEKTDLSATPIEGDLTEGIDRTIGKYSGKNGKRGSSGGNGQKGGTGQITYDQLSSREQKRVNRLLAQYPEGDISRPAVVTVDARGNPIWDDESDPAVTTQSKEEEKKGGKRAKARQRSFS